METRFLTEEQFLSLKQEVPEVMALAYFKLVFVGNNIIAEAENDAEQVKTLTDERPGYYLISEDLEQLNIDLHEIIERFYDKLEESNDGE